MQDSVKITNIVKLYALLLLSEKKKHGYELIKELSGKLDKRISAGEIYPFLNRLKKAGYIKVESSGTREKKTYVLTPSGKKFVKNMLVKFSSLIELAIEPSLTQCAHCGCKIFGGGFVKKIRDKSFAFCCKYCAKGFRN
ncbi:MAG: PadR family transcriptional regulator [Candidatus Aenigmatarchaeota archaeon]